MKKPNIIFRPMTLEENIDLIKWSYFEENGSLDVHNYTIQYFEQLSGLEKLAKEEIYKKIEEVVTSNYYLSVNKINDEVKRYNDIWKAYNDLYFNELTNYLNIEWPEEKQTIDASVGLIPVFPRNIDSFSFSISTDVSVEKLVGVAAHEALHFLWFEKWKQLFPDADRKELDAPHLPWQYSEMVVDPVLNSKEIYNVLHVKEKAYDSFYNLENNGVSIMNELTEIYNKPISVEEKIVKGYEYIFNALDLTNQRLK